MKAFRGDKSLNLGSFAVLLSVLLNGAADHVFADIVFLGKVEKLSDVVGSFGTKAAWLRGVCTKL